MSSKKPFEMFSVFLEANEAAKQKAGLLDRAISDLLSTERKSTSENSSTNTSSKLGTRQKAVA